MPDCRDDARPQGRKDHDIYAQTTDQSLLEELARRSAAPEIIGSEASAAVQGSQGIAPEIQPFGPTVVHDGRFAGGRRPRVQVRDVPLMSVREAARALGVCTAIVHRLVESGAVPHVRVSNAIRIAPSDLRAYVSASRKTRGRRRTPG